MTWNFYLDESGHDGKTTPLVVVGGFGIEAAKQDALIYDVKKLYKECFGFIYDGNHELKGSWLLHKKKFDWAAYYPEMSDEDRHHHAGRFFNGQTHNTTPMRRDFCGYGQACLLFTLKLFDVIKKHECLIVASLSCVDEMNSYSSGTGAYLTLLEQKLFENINKFLQSNHITATIYADQTDSTADTIKLEKFLNVKYSNILGLNFLNSSDNLTIQIADIILYFLNRGLGVGYIKDIFKVIPLKNVIRSEIQRFYNNFYHFNDFNSYIEYYKINKTTIILIPYYIKNKKASAFPPKLW